MQSLSIGPATVMLANTVYALPAVQSILYTTGSPTITQSSTADFAASTAVTLTDGYATLTGSFLRCTTQITVTLRKGAVGGVGITGPTPVVSGNIVIYDGTDGAVVADSGSSIADITAAAAAVVVAGPIPESAVTDGALLARVAGTETISGAWTHSGATTFSNTTTFSDVARLNSGIEISGYKFMYVEDHLGYSEPFTWDTPDQNDTFILHLSPGSTTYYTIYSIQRPPTVTGRLLTIYVDGVDTHAGPITLANRYASAPDAADIIFCPFNKDLIIPPGGSALLCYMPANDEGAIGWRVISTSAPHQVYQGLTITSPDSTFTTGLRFDDTEIDGERHWQIGFSDDFYIAKTDENFISAEVVFRSYWNQSANVRDLSISNGLVGATRIEAALTAHESLWQGGTTDGGAYIVNVTSDDAANEIRGIWYMEGGGGRLEGYILRLYCNSVRFWIMHENASASADYRIHCPAATSIQVQQYGCVTLRYNTLINRWQVISQT